jgi:hypothetical protein
VGNESWGQTASGVAGSDDSAVSNAVNGAFSDIASMQLNTIQQDEQVATAGKRVSDTDVIDANLDDMAAFSTKVYSSLGAVESPSSSLHHGNFEPAGTLTNSAAQPLAEAASFHGNYSGWIGSAVNLHWQQVGNLKAVSSNVNQIATSYLVTDLEHKRHMTKLQAMWDSFSFELSGKTNSIMPASYTGKGTGPTGWTAPQQGGPAATPVNTGTSPEVTSMSSPPAQGRKPSLPPSTDLRAPAPVSDQPVNPESLL